MLIQLIRGGLGEQVIINGQPYVKTAKEDRGVIVYGPYEDRAASFWKVSFSVGLADDALPVADPICAQIEVLTNEGGTLVAERRILFSELGRDVRTFELEFQLQEPRKLEYRVQANAQVSILVGFTVQITEGEEARVSAEPRGSQLRAWQYEREFLDGYLRNVSGVIHVGANYGQERRYYWLIGLDVLWVEPITEVYQELVDYITKFPRQKAVNALLTDKKGQEVEFSIASNNGASSSILQFQEHSDIYPDVRYVEKRKLISTTLADMIKDGNIDLDNYQALTIDTEGAELMVLQGALPILSRFKYVKCEASDFESRSGNPSLAQLDALLQDAGFSQIGRRDFGMGPGYRGTNWDVVWKKVDPGEPLNETGYALPIVFDPMEVHGIEKDG